MGEPYSNAEPRRSRDQGISGTVGVIRLFGVPVRLHFTFLLLLVFLLFIGIGQRQSGAMTAVYVLALFGSVLLHEFGHALMARRYGIRTLEIVMFPIGGLARLEKLPRAKDEFWIAIAGPAVNFFIVAAIVAALALRGDFDPANFAAAYRGEPTDANLLYRIADGNLILALFNLLPAYPMDGGRILRSLLARRKPEDEATRIAARAGQGLAVAMGLFGLLGGNFMLIFIAFFVYLGASQEANMAVSRAVTSGYPVRSAMITDFRTLPHGASIRQAGELLLATSQQDFPVVHGDQVLGMLTRSRLLRAMLTEGPEAYVASAMERGFNRVAPDLDLNEAMTELGPNASALVMEGDRLLGLLTSENLMEFIMLRQMEMAQAKLQAR